MQYTANTTCRLPNRRAELQRKLERAGEWSRKPMTGRAAIAVPAAAGAITFALLFAVYMIA